MIKLMRPPESPLILINERLPMPALMKFLHVLAAIAWLGGISFMLFALRPAATELLGRGMRVTAMIQDGELQLMDAERSITLRPRWRMRDGVAVAN